MGRPTLSLASTSAASRSVSRIGASPWAALSMTPSARPKNKQKVIISMHLDRFSIIMLHSLSHKTSFSLAISLSLSLSLSHTGALQRIPPTRSDTQRRVSACISHHHALPERRVRPLPPLALLNGSRVAEHRSGHARGTLCAHSRLGRSQSLLGGLRSPRRTPRTLRLAPAYHPSTSPSKFPRLPQPPIPLPTLTPLTSSYLPPPAPPNSPPRRVLGARARRVGSLCGVSAREGGWGSSE